MEKSNLKESFEKQQFQNQANLVYYNTIAIGFILVVLYFFVLRTYTVALANIGLLLVSGISIHLNRKKIYGLSSFLFIIMVTFTACLQIHFFGLSTGFQYFFINLSGLVMFTNWKPQYKLLGILILTSLFLYSFRMGFRNVPLTPLPDKWVYFLHSVNVLLNIAGVANSANYYISITRNAHDRLSDLAMKDYLTGLMNRTSFDQILLNLYKTAHSRTHGYSMMFLDMDHFKNINDTYGHLCGDELLRQFGKALQQQTRKEDCVARYGGEEFIIITESNSLEESALFAERVRKTVETMHFSYQNIVIPMTISIGVLFIPKDNMTPPEYALERTDQLLYQAKSQGRNLVIAGEIL